MNNDVTDSHWLYDLIWVNSNNLSLFAEATGKTYCPTYGATVREHADKRRHQKQSTCLWSCQGHQALLSSQ